MAEKHRIRTDQFRFTLLPEESAMLTKNAFELGLSKADYLRKIILYGSIIGQHPVMDKEQGRQLLYEVNRIGNNINQILLIAHTNGFLDTPRLRSALEELKEADRLVFRTYAGKD